MPFRIKGLKKFLIAGGLLIPTCLALVLITLRIVGFEPRDRRPGFWVTGELVTTPVTDWSFTDQVEEIYVETRTWYFIPHSVNTYCATYNGQLYLFSAYYRGGEFPQDRFWNQNVMRDPRVRLKIGNQLFDRTLSFVTDAAEKEAVIQTFMEKYPEWRNPGIENVHTFRVLPG